MKLTDARVSALALTVRDLDRALGFWRGLLGLRVFERLPGSVTLGAGAPFLELVHDAGAPEPGRRSGLFHVALLYPDRGALAQALRRLADAGYPLQGASDHGVSEALYLSDPEGNGVELYRDRERGRWPMEDGGLAMRTLPLDVPALLSDADGAGPPAPPEATRIGHVHLAVGDVGAAERFYADVIGLELTQRYGAAASFLAAGGYHHHVGLNEWGTAGAPPALSGARGLRWFELAVPPGDVKGLVSRLGDAGVAYRAEETVECTDPAGLSVRVRADRDDRGSKGES